MRVVSKFETKQQDSLRQAVPERRKEDATSGCCTTKTSHENNSKESRFRVWQRQSLGCDTRDPFNLRHGPVILPCNEILVLRTIDIKRCQRATTGKESSRGCFCQKATFLLNFLLKQRSNYQALSMRTTKRPVFEVAKRLQRTSEVFQC